MIQANKTNHYIPIYLYNMLCFGRGVKRKNHFDFGKSASILPEALLYMVMNLYIECV
jgi:hypothetical protein